MSERDLIDEIQRLLESHGWRAEAGEGWRWVDHTCTSAGATLRVRYLPGVDVIRLDFETEKQLERIAITFDGLPSHILDLIVRDQPSLSEATWPAFIASLIPLSLQVRVLTEPEVEEG